jgi:hypothetical protein
MNRQIAARALLLASVVFASSAFAGNNDIQKCVTETGHVTLTDEVCPSGAQTVKVISGPADTEEQAAVPHVRTVSTERFGPARVPARNIAQMKHTAPSRGLTLDVSTLRAAHANMQMFDNASSSLRQQRLAGLQ